MRAILFAMLIAIGIGLVGNAPSAQAAPVSGTAISDTAKLGNPVQQVQHWRWRSRRYHSRWRSRGGFGRCHVRHWSRWVRC